MPGLAESPAAPVGTLVELVTVLHPRDEALRVARKVGWPGADAQGTVPDHPNTHNILAWPVKVFEAYGYTSSSSLLKEARKNLEICAETTDPNVVPNDDNPWSILGVPEDKRAAFDAHHFTTETYGQDTLAIDEIGGYLEGQDPEGLRKLHQIIGRLESSGHPLTLHKLKTPPLYAQGAFKTLQDTQHGTAWFEAFLAHGIEPVILQAEVQEIRERYNQKMTALAGLSSKSAEQEMLHEAAQKVLATEKDRALDFAGATKQLKALSDISLYFTASGQQALAGNPGLLKDFEEANRILGQVRAAYTADRVIEDHNKDAFDTAAKIIITSVVTAVGFSVIQNIPGVPHAVYEAGTGFSDDILTLLALLVSAEGLTKARWAVQAGVGTVALIGAYKLVEHMDTLAQRGGIVPHFEAGATFGTAAVGVAAIGSVILAGQNAFDLQQDAADGKLPFYLHLPNEQREKVGDSKDLATAREVIIEWATNNEELEPAQRLNIEQKLANIREVDWQGQLQSLLHTPSFGKLASQSIAERGFQKRLLASTAAAFVIDTALSGYHFVRDKAWFLALFGSSEASIAAGSYWLRNLHLAQRSLKAVGLGRARKTKAPAQ